MYYKIERQQFANCKAKMLHFYDLLKTLAYISSYQPVLALNILTFTDSEHSVKLHNEYVLYVSKSNHTFNVMFKAQLPDF